MKGRHSPANTGVEAPGPGTYNVNDPNYGNAPKYTMLSRKTGPGDKQNTPGPGTYEEKTRVGSGPKKTMGSRHAVIKSSDTAPGPGAYSSLQKPLGSQGVPKYTMRPKPASPSSRDQGPGPGSQPHS